MKRLLTRSSANIGLPPGTLVHVGELLVAEPTITLVHYTEESFEERQVESIQECFPLPEEPAITWINIDGLNDVETVGAVAERIGLHPLIAEDILNTQQRPKAEVDDEHVVVILKAFDFEDGWELGSEQISIVLGRGYVISFQEQPGDTLEAVRQRLRQSKGRIRRMGADYLAYALLDSVVDGYLALIEAIGDALEATEDALIEDPASVVPSELYAIRRHLSRLRRSIWPLREVLTTLERGDSGLVRKPVRPYLRDAYEHVVQAIDVVEIYRDTLAGMLDVHLSSISNSMNAVMKVLTLIGTIFIPLTFLAGVYGMNFRHMPELSWTWSYPALWAVMVAIAVAMIAYFRKRDWL